VGGYPFAAGDSPWPTVSVEMEVVPYDEKRGVATFWDRDSWLRLEANAMGGEQFIVVAGNPAGLRSLARHLLTLAQESMPDHHHLDFDWYTAVLGSNSVNLRIEVDKVSPAPNDGGWRQ
jgi:hypothetical protein